MRNRFVSYLNAFFKTEGAHSTNYQAPINLTSPWCTGSVSGLSLVVQLISGLFLSMHFSPTELGAFDSIQHIMRDVEWGWLARYVHANGASLFFVVIYLHILRAFYYKGYLRVGVWYSGLLIYILLMATAFLGYVLPWGQMSYWGATVITNFFSAIPLVGQFISEFLWGGYSVGGPTLSRFYSLHFVLPFIIAALAVCHIILVHQAGSTHNLGGESINNAGFSPSFLLKDLIAFCVYFIVLTFFVCFEPNTLGHSSNYILADGMATPDHIVPEWYFLPFYAILRSVPDKLLGVSLMFGSIAVLFFLPFIDKPIVQGTHHRYTYKFFLLLFLINSVVLAYIGGQEAAEPFVVMGQEATAFYFFFFIFIIPLTTLFDDWLLKSGRLDQIKQFLKG